MSLEMGNKIVNCEVAGHENRSEEVGEAGTEVESKGRDYWNMGALREHV